MAAVKHSASPQPGVLGDTPQRDYSAKLRLFNAFAAPELRQAIAALPLRRGMRVLDVGCGTGEALVWLREIVGPEGAVIGLDLAAAHTLQARNTASPPTLVIQANANRPPLKRGTFDLIWSVNTLNHVREPLEAVRALLDLLKPGGCIALGQSSFVPDMYFAWDARLEDRVNQAVRRYYRERYDVDEHALRAVRGLVGLLQAAGAQQAVANTVVIERVSPLDPATERYLQDAVFRDTWGERLRPYLNPSDFEELQRLCDPERPQYALHRPDFHYLHTLTFVQAAR